MEKTAVPRLIRGVDVQKTPRLVGRGEGTFGEEEVVAKPQTACRAPGLPVCWRRASLFMADT